MATLSVTIVKSLESDLGDSEKEGSEKTLAKKQLELGVVSAKAIAANTILESHAREIQIKSAWQLRVRLCRGIEPLSRIEFEHLPYQITEMQLCMT